MGLELWSLYAFTRNRDRDFVTGLEAPRSVTKSRSLFLVNAYKPELSNALGRQYKVERWLPPASLPVPIRKGNSASCCYEITLTIL